MDYDDYLMMTQVDEPLDEEEDMGEIELDENGDWVWVSATDFEWDRFERCYWQAEPITVHPALRERAQLGPDDEVTDVSVQGPETARYINLTLYDRARDTLHFEVVKCTRLERVQWGLEDDPYRDTNSIQEKANGLYKIVLAENEDAEKAKFSKVLLEQYGEEFEE